MRTTDVVIVLLLLLVLNDAKGVQSPLLSGSVYHYSFMFTKALFYIVVLADL